MILKRIKKLKNVGIFKEFEGPNPNSFPDFKKYNIIYGWNGTGKSTISRLLQSLGQDKELPTEFRNSEFEILFSDENGDQSVINQNNTEAAPLIRVFNQKFISNHIKWEKIQADSIAYFGEEVDRKKELDKLREEVGELTDEQSFLKEGKDGVFKEITKWKSNHAKIIKDTLTTEGRTDQYANYDSLNISTRLNDTFSDRDKDYSYHIKLNEELSKIKKAIYQSPKDKLPNARLEITGLSDLYESLKDLLDKTVVSKAIDELKEKPEVEKWVRTGFHIHQENDLDTCQFCKQKIPNERMAKLEGHFSDTYDDFLGEIESLKHRIKQAHIELDHPHELKVDSSFQEDYKAKLEDFKELEEKYKKIKKELINEIERKENKLHKSLELTITFDRDFESDIQEIVRKINQIIENHNQIVENFEEEILRKKEIWEKSHIASNLDELIELEKKEEDFEEVLKELKEQIEALRKKNEKLLSELSDNRRAAEELNKYLTQYLGRNDIQVVFNEETKGFHFKRGDDEATNLSEGEKTGIALIYFLTKLGERDFHINDCIVVIDDPVSSLDANSLFYAFSFIKEHCKEAKQLILMTHNFELLRQINKWFRHEKGSKFSRFMIKCSQNKDDRFSEIDKMDELLTKFESEYHYLFKLLYDKKESEEDSLSSVYNYPNVTRRYLEMFFSFRTPGVTQMHSKIKEAVQKGAITQTEGTAIHHFLNVYSHGDTEESFTRFDVTHLSNSKKAIASALKLVENYDHDHYKAMVELVT